MPPTVDHAHAAFTLVRDVLLPSGAITHAQAHTLINALIHLLSERRELSMSILRMEAAMVNAQRARDGDPETPGGTPDAG